LSAGYCDDDGKAALQIVDNEAVVSRGVWDVKLEGTLLTVRRGQRDVVARLRIDGTTSTITLEHLAMSLANGRRIDIDDKRGIQYGGIRIAGNNTYGGRVGVHIGVIDPQTKRPQKLVPGDLTIAINDPSAGRWEDWITPQAPASFSTSTEPTES
jgi:hypothetical protein